MLDHQITKKEIESHVTEVIVCRQSETGQSKTLSYLRVESRMWWKVTFSQGEATQPYFYNRIESAIDRYNNTKGL